MFAERSEKLKLAGLRIQALEKEMNEKKEQLNEAEK